MKVSAYRDRTSGRYPISLAEVRASVSMLFGEVPDPWVLDEANVDPVLATDRPAYDLATHSISEGEPVLSDGAWRQTWALTALPPPPPIVITADVLFVDRMTDEEYDDLDASVKAGETARVYRGWAAATVFTEGSVMWVLLERHLSLVATAERKAELLARPIQSAALAGDEPLAA